MTAYHPQADSQTEHVNQSLEQYLRCYVDYNLQDWSRLLSTAEFAYNNQAHEGTKESPFFLEYGRHPRAGPTLLKEATNVDLNDIMKRRFEAQEQAKAALLLAAERMKWYYDQGVQRVPFKVGDKVLLNLRDYQKTQRAFNPRYEGPFEIIERLSDVTFKLKMPPAYRDIHPVFHASKLVTYNESTIPGQNPPPPKPVTIKNTDEWEVEKILQHRIDSRTGKTEYFVQWKGFSRGDNSWEPAENLQNAQEKIQEYLKLGYEPANKRPTRTKRARNVEAEDEIPKELLTRDSTLVIHLGDGATMPTRDTENAAGLTLYASESIEIGINTRARVNTGLSIQLPSGTLGRTSTRSSDALKGIDVVGTIVSQDNSDSIRVILVNTSDRVHKVHQSDAIALLTIERIATVLQSG